MNANQIGSPAFRKAAVVAKYVGLTLAGFFVSFFIGSLFALAYTNARALAVGLPLVNPVELRVTWANGCAVVYALVAGIYWLARLVVWADKQ